jgi:hypothetical protein
MTQLLLLFFVVQADNIDILERCGCRRRRRRRSNVFRRAYCTNVQILLPMFFTEMRLMTVVVLKVFFF